MQKKILQRPKAVMYGSYKDHLPYELALFSFVMFLLIIEHGKQEDQSKVAGGRHHGGVSQPHVGAQPAPKCCIKISPMFY